MNYYIQGNAANADKIKAAFEKKGLTTPGRDYHNDNILFFTYDLEGGCKVISSTNANLIMAKLIKTHPDYKELELPVEPKFKVGDWVVKKDGTTFYGGNYAEQITIIESEEWDKRIWFSSTTWLRENDIRLWTIADAKDGDVLVTTKIRGCPFIYRKTSYNNRLAYYYAGIDGNGNFCEGCLKRTLFHFGSVENVVPATKEQRDLLFQKMKEEGYEWDADKKELKKIQPHYDITNFKPKQWVLVRDDDEWEWALTRFGYLSNGSASLFVCINGASFQQCIPYEGNEHLLGTTDMPSEEYINW